MAAAPARKGTVYLVGAGPGDPRLLTQRGLELLSTADVILHDELIHPVLLRAARADAEVRHVGKRGSEPAAKQLKQDEIDRMIVAEAQAGRSVVRLKGGDPFLFGRGSEECEALARAGVPFEVVPGVTSPLAAAAYAGVSLTHRDLASSVTFVSGTTRHGEAFDFSRLRGLGGTLVVLMGLGRLREIARALVEQAGRSPETPALAIQSGTLPWQRSVEGTIVDIAERVEAAKLKTPVLAVIGEVVSLRQTIRWFDAWPLFGKRVLVGRAEHQAEGTSALLRARGAEPFELPLIRIQPPATLEPLARCVTEASTYDLVAFTSENGVRAFFEAARAARRDARVFGKARIAAIGEGTAAALAERGIVADVVPAVFRGEALAAACIADLETTRGTARGARVLVPRATVAREIFPETLRAAGAEVDVVFAYETKAIEPERAAELRRAFERGELDVVLLTSSSMASSLCDALGEGAGAILERALVASIGPITTKTAEGRGLRVRVTAGVSTIEGLVEAVERHIESETSRRA
ncbi:MAG: uroporphyrinogen-III C-methyltransferase [Myxococcales bacterium]|nr:uroporphyrinogen-III C-methyltransferase [Myxococcales bacterium]